METKTIVKAFEKELNLTEQGFNSLSEQKKGLVINVKTDAGFKLARKERTEQNNIIKDIDRLAIDGKNSIDKVRTLLKERVIKIFSPTITAFEAENLRRKEEKEKLAKKEEERIASIKSEINGIRNFSLNLFGQTSEEISGIIEAVDLIDVSENFSELTQEAISVKKEVLGELNLALSSAIQNEQLEAERAKLKVQELKLKAQERLNNLMIIPTTMFGKTSKEIEKMIYKVEHNAIIESEFGDLFQQANDSVKTVIHQLGTMLSQTKFMEEQKNEPQEEITAGNQSHQEQEQTPKTAVESDGIPFCECGVITCKGECKQVPETKIISEQNRTHSHIEVTPITWHQKMIKQVDFWYNESGSYDNLMSILNQYKSI